MSAAAARTGLRWLKFNGVGVMGFALQLAVLAGLEQWAGLDYMIASFIAVEVAIIHNFFWHDSFTWSDREPSSAGSLVRFCRFNLTAGAISIAGNLLMMKWLVGVLQVSYLAANVASVLTCSVLNFFVSDSVVFTNALLLSCSADLRKNDAAANQSPGWIRTWIRNACRRWRSAFSRLTLKRRHAALFLLFLVLVLTATGSGAAELKAETVAAFDRYVQETEARMAAEVETGGAFLYPDSLPESQKNDAYERLRRGEVVIEKLTTLHQGKSISVPSGLIHHWVGIIFVPGASLEKTLAVAQDYDNREVIYRPDVVRSRLLSRNDDDYKIFMRFYKKGFSTVVLNTEYLIHYFKLDSYRVWCKSYSTHIGEVADPNHPDGPELPAGQEHGYLWRLYSYWRFQQKDGGVYIQCEVISLTRGIPFGLNWLLGPLVKSIPRESLNRTLFQTRAAIVAPSAPATSGR